MNLQMRIQLPIMLLIVLACGASGYISYQNAATNLYIALVDNMRGEAESLVRTINDMTLGVVADTQRIAQQNEIREFYNKAIHDKSIGEEMSALLKGLEVTYDDFDRIALLDTAGIVVASTALASIGQNFGDRDYFREAIKGKTFLSQPLKSRVSGEGVLIAATPVMHGNEIMGVIYSSIPLKHLYESSVKPVTVGNQGYAFVLEKGGLIAVHANMDWIFNSTLSSVPHYKEMASATMPGIKDFIGNTGVRVFNYYAGDSFSGLTAVIQAEYDDVFSGMTELRNNSIIVSLVAILLSGLLTILIMRPILNAISNVVVYAVEIARGNFEAKVEIKEKGELGEMADALRSIPLVLQRLMGEAHELTRQIHCGNYRARIDTSSFHQGFAELTSMFNGVSDSYTDTLDHVPVPIMTCDRKFTVLFLNEPAQKMVGGNREGEACAKLLCADVCGSAQCLSQIAMNSDAAYTNEVIVRPLGVQMNVSVTTAPLHDNSGTVVGALELLTDLTEIKNKQNTILRVAEHASIISDRVTTAAEELSAQVEQVSRGTELQRSRVESTASAITEMNSTVFAVARSAEQASGQSEQTKNKASDGSRLVNQVVQSIQLVNGITATLHTNMQDLGHQAEGIGGVMNVISDIADQTNLLALNAAIEAARAGDAGRGFAVVADEVRKLAEKTMQATQEVGSKIVAIQNSARVNIESVAEASKAVENATGLATLSGNALTEIVTLASASSASVTSIATSAEEQSATSEEINRAVEEISHIVSETAIGMVQASRAVQDLSQVAQELNRVMEELK